MATTTPRQRLVLLASVALIAAYWTSSALGFLLGRMFGVIDLPEIRLEGVRHIAMTFCGIAVATTVVVAALLRGSGERLTDLGFRPALPRRPPLGAPWVALACAALGFVGAIVLSGGERAVADRAPSVLDALAAHDPHGRFWLAVLLVVGGGYREELMRAFCVTRFERVFGSAGLVSAVIVDSVVFGLGHYYQGGGAVIGTAIMGFVYAAVFLRRRRVVDAMIVHAAMNLSVTAGRF